MSILWGDHFKGYGNDQDLLLDGLYAQINNSFGGNATIVDDPDPNAEAGSKALRFGTGLTHSGATTVRYVLPNGALTTVGCSIRMWSVGLPDQTEEEFQIFRWTDIDNTLIATLRQRTTGQMTFAYNGTDIVTSTLPVLTANAYNHIEAKLTVGDGTGAFEVRVDGIEVAGMTVSSQSFGTTDISQISFRRPATGASVIVPPQINLKDFVVWDTNGSENNDFIGSCGVYYLPVTADVTIPWSLSSGSDAFDLLNDSPPVDTDFIEADNTLPDAARFEFEDVPVDVVSVKALITVHRSRKTDGGEAQVQTALESETDLDNGTDRPITSAFTYWPDVSEVSPDTGVAWTPTEANEATVQIDRTV